MRRSVHDLIIERQPLNTYGSLEHAIRTLRDHRPLDLNAEIWREKHPGGTFQEWRDEARACVLRELHYNPGPLDLRAETLAREERPDYILEHVAFNTTPWFRVEGYMLIPRGVPLPVPGLLVLHAWGGPMLFGKERVVNTGRDHPVLVEHRAKYYSGRYLTEVFVRSGYAVLVIDAFHFGVRAPRGIGGLPAEYDPWSLDVAAYRKLDEEARAVLRMGVTQLNWAGTTWMGVNFWDDRRALDYLLTRPEVDPERVGCTGLSGGAWRTNFLAALDDRIKAAVSVGWMSTGDYQQIYNVRGAIGTFCLLPGVWDRLDLPDLTVMSAPAAVMVVVGTEDLMIPPEGAREATRQAALGYEWAGCPERYRAFFPSKPHCYDAEVQEEAIAWFDRHLKGR